MPSAECRHGVAVDRDVSAHGFSHHTAEEANVGTANAVRGFGDVRGGGDIADCGPGAAMTARLLDALAGTIFTAGDNAYDAGTEAEFATCFAPTWGRHLARIRPSPGTHDYVTAGAAGYFGYFGDRAGPAGRGYYSFDLGAWHIVSLNSNVSVAAGSEQDRWLAADLAAARQRCVLAFWHHPRFSSALHGSDPSLTDLWRALYDARADLVVNGHDHTYERFAPQTPSGAADSIRGIREFVVGTGGAPLYSFVRIEPNSEVRYNGGWGVLSCRSTTPAMRGPSCPPKAPRSPTVVPVSVCR